MQGLKMVVCVYVCDRTLTLHSSWFGFTISQLAESLGGAVTHTYTNPFSLSLSSDHGNHCIPFFYACTHPTAQIPPSNSECHNHSLATSHSSEEYKEFGQWGLFQPPVNQKQPRCKEWIQKCGSHSGMLATISGFQQLNPALLHSSNPQPLSDIVLYVH